MPSEIPLSRSFTVSIAIIRCLAPCCVSTNFLWPFLDLGVALVVLWDSSILGGDGRTWHHILVDSWLEGGVCEMGGEKFLFFWEIGLLGGWEMGRKVDWKKLGVLKGNNVAICDCWVCKILRVSRTYRWIIFPNLNDLSRTQKTRLF